MQIGDLIEQLKTVQTRKARAEGQIARYKAREKELKSALTEARKKAEDEIKAAKEIG